MIHKASYRSAKFIFSSNSCCCSQPSGVWMLTCSISFSSVALEETCFARSFPIFPVLWQYRSKISFRFRNMASSGRSSAISSGRMETSASRYSSPDNSSNPARSTPSTSTRMILWGIFTICFTSEMMPTANTSSCSGFSISGSRCVTTNSGCPSATARSTAFTDLERLTSKWVIIPGRIVIPRNATAGIFSVEFSIFSSPLRSEKGPYM